MKVILFGASGMVGQGVLRECLLDPNVDRVLLVGRHATGQLHEKIREIVVPDLSDLTSVQAQLGGYDGCFFCAGVSSAGMTESDYRRVTHDLTLTVGRTLAPLNPGMTFVYVSGAGTDSTEKGRSMWARVKGQTENDLLRLPFKAAYMFRPGIIRAGRGIHSRTPVYRLLYIVLWPIVAVAGVVAPHSVTTNAKVGQAMINAVRRGAPSSWLGTREINDLAQ